MAVRLPPELGSATAKYLGIGLKFRMNLQPNHNLDNPITAFYFLPINYELTNGELLNLIANRE